MGETGKVVARYLEGNLLKGTTQDFYPNRPGFHLIPEDGGAAVQVDCSRLKAVFFVKSLEGGPRHSATPSFLTAPAATAHGKKIAVRFKDGEILAGYTLSYMPGRQGFIVFPADPESNNLRVYVLAAATTEVRAGAQAEDLVRKALSGGASGG